MVPIMIDRSSGKEKGKRFVAWLRFILWVVIQMSESQSDDA